MIPLSKLNACKKSAKPAVGEAKDDLTLEQHDIRCHGGEYEGGNCGFRKERGIPTFPFGQKDLQIDGEDKVMGQGAAAAEYLDSLKQDGDDKAANRAVVAIAKAIGASQNLREMPMPDCKDDAAPAPAPTTDTGAKVNHALVTDEDVPAVYIGTFGHYNDGNLDGVGEASGWIDLTTFASAEEFMKWLAEQAAKSGEEHEFMFQDHQGYPDEMYSESSVGQSVWDYMKVKKDCEDGGMSDDAIADILEVLSFDDFKKAQESGKIHVYDGDGYASVAKAIVDEAGDDAFDAEDYEEAFDYGKYGRDFATDFEVPPTEDGEEQSIYQFYGVEEGDDATLGAMLVDNAGGVENLPMEKVKECVDWDMLGASLQSEGTWINSYDKDSNPILIHIED